jgi:hypothetical protein
MDENWGYPYSRKLPYTSYVSSCMKSKKSDILMDSMFSVNFMVENPGETSGNTQDSVNYQTMISEHGYILSIWNTISQQLKSESTSRLFCL